jgi:predicted Zn-dependent peptidase
LDDAYALNGETILESAAALLGELLLAPDTENGVFRADYVEGEKANLIDRIRGQINDKRTYATYRLTQLMCKEEAFGVSRLGDEGHVSAITPDALWRRYQELLRSAAIEVYYCGSADPDRAAAALTAALAALPVNEDRTVPDCEVRISAGSEPNVVEEAMDVSQGKLALGFRTGGVTCWEQEYPALLLCNAIYGGTSLSKLFMNVREKLSLCYYASSVLEKQKGLLLVSSGIEFEQYHTARNEILAQLDAIRRGEMEEWEMEGGRRTLIGSCLSALDDQGRQEEYWLAQAVAGLEETPEELAARLETVTPEQVSEAAKKLQLDTIYFLKGKEG